MGNPHMRAGGGGSDGRPTLPVADAGAVMERQKPTRSRPSAVATTSGATIATSQAIRYEPRRFSRNGDISRWQRQRVPAIVAACPGLHRAGRHATRGAEIALSTQTTDAYGHEYYATHCAPLPDERSYPDRSRLFGSTADELIRSLRPKQVFDAGCAHGFLVEALRDAGA
jgi:hypothetical protein